MSREQELGEIVSRALDHAAEAVAIFTADEDLVGSEIVFVNEAFVKMTGYARDALVGHSALLLLGQRPALEDVRAALGTRQGGPYYAVTRRTRSDGTEYDVELRVNAMHDATGKITHHVLSHREIRSATTDTEAWSTSSSSLGLAVSGLRAVGTAVDDVVSELRDAVVELAVLEDSRCDELTERIGDALEAAADAQDVIGELGMLARTDAAPRVMDVHETLELAVRITRGIVGSSARLVRRYEEVPAVHANASALARTFAQLIQNAAAAIPPFLPVANSITLQTYEDCDGNVVVEISDTGVGMSQEVVHKVFDPFFTTRGGHAADGLGLTIARADILAAGGAIGVESVEGRGSRFTVRLPAVGGPVSTLPLTPSNDLPLRRVLVACSDPTVARQLRAFFEDERTCVVDTDIEEAADRLARADSYDLVVSDARDPHAKTFRARIAETAPEAMMRLFEITADTSPLSTSLKKSEKSEHPSGVRLAVVGGTEARMR